MQQVVSSGDVVALARAKTLDTIVAGEAERLDLRQGRLVHDHLVSVRVGVRVRVRVRVRVTVRGRVRGRVRVRGSPTSITAPTFSGCNVSGGPGGSGAAQRLTNLVRMRARARARARVWVWVRLGRLTSQGWS